MTQPDTTQKASNDQLKNKSNISYLDDDINNLVLPPEGCCFHCGEPVPTPPFKAEILGESRLMCCMGCQLAAESIVEANLEQYYLDRSEINRTARLPTELERLKAYDHEDIKSQFVYASEGQSVAELSVNNLRCAACTWLIEARLDELDGVKNCQVNLTNQRMRVVWDDKKLPISEILSTINQIGYDAKPYRQDTHEAMLAKHNKQMLIRLGIAALGAMQAMMFAVGMYFGKYASFGGMLIEQRDFLRWVSLFVTVPVFFYCAVPFFASAWSAVKARQVNMDVPVSIALIVTFFASLYATLMGHGETYYDSVSMFVFFLLAGRYIEHNARLKAANMANDLVVIEPTLVKRIGSEPQLVEELKKSHQGLIIDTEDATLSKSSIVIDNVDTSTDSSIDLKINKTTVKDSIDLIDELRQKLKNLGQLIHTVKNTNQNNDVDKPSESVTANSLRIGDVIMIDAGSEVVADGILCTDTATVSQSLLTGESELIVKKRGEVVVGGSQNDSQPFVMIVTALPENSQIALIDRLMNRAMSEKPKIAEQADKWARWFVARILVLSVMVFIGWYFIDPSEALWATVAVLVATCPCALSLATPIALTISTNRLASYGFLTTRGHTIQTLAEITHVAFDKTGTLTYGKPNLLYVANIANENSSHENSLNDETLLALAAALEVGSRHPIASALLDAAYQLHLPKVNELKHYPAGGVEAVINDAGEGFKYRLGHVNFALNRSVDGKKQESQYQGLDQKYIPQLNKYNASSAVMLTRTKVTHVEITNANTEWEPLALFYFNDSVREGVAEMITSLQNQNIDTMILTGDPSQHAQKVAKELNIDKLFYGLSPKDKVNHIKKLQDKGHIVMMVGDGINDAPVLAAANISTAMAGAADLAQVSSDSVILNGAVTAVEDAKRVADKAQHIIKQNIRWAIGYNTVVLIPAALGYVPPWLAAIGMSLSSLVVVMNALRLKRA